MKISAPVVLAAALLGLVLTSAPAAAQVIRVEIPFQFAVMEKTAPAGSYEVELKGEAAVTLRSTTNPSVQFLLPVVTRLGAPGESKSKIVFDKIGTAASLSEVWFSGRDGFLVGVTKAAHTHQTVTSSGK